MKKSIHHEIRVVTSINPEVYAADETGDTVDTGGFAAREAVYHVGTAGDVWSGSDTIEPKILDSNDDGGSDPYTEVAAAKIEGTLDTLNLAATHQERVYRYGLKEGVKRYVKLYLDFTGTHATGTIIGASVILAEPTNAPTDNP